MFVRRLEYISEKIETVFSIVNIASQHCGTARHYKAVPRCLSPAANYVVQLQPTLQVLAIIVLRHVALVRDPLTLPPTNVVSQRGSARLTDALSPAVAPTQKHSTSANDIVTYICLIFIFAATTDMLIPSVIVRVLCHIREYFLLPK